MGGGWQEQNDSPVGGRDGESEQGKSREGRKGGQPGLSLLWVVFLMWESVWVGSFSVCTSEVLSTCSSDLPAPNALIFELQRTEGSGL